MQRFRPPEADPTGVLYVRPSLRVAGAEFGRDELKHVLAAGLALTAIFAGAFAVGAGGVASPFFPARFLFFLPLAFIAAFPAFLLSLILQKRVAQSQGCTTEFRILVQWLFISVLFAFLFGFVFAAPGSVRRFGNLTRSGAGKMSAAVPLSFIAVGGGALTGLLIFATSPGGVANAVGGFYLIWVLAVVARVNSIMAAFSMIPVPGFAGGDIWRWSKVFFSGLIVAAVALFWASSAMAPYF